MIEGKYAFISGFGNVFFCSSVYVIDKCLCSIVYEREDFYLYIGERVGEKFFSKIFPVCFLKIEFRICRDCNEIGVKFNVDGIWSEVESLSPGDIWIARLSAWVLQK